MSAAVLDSAVSTRRYAHLDLEVEITDRCRFPGNEMIPLERAVGLSGQDAFVHRPKLRIARPAPHATPEQARKTVAPRTVRHGGGGLGMRGRGNTQRAFLGGEGTTQLF